MADQPLVGIIMGSKSDLPTMEACTKQLEELGVPYELVIASAHRNPAEGPRVGFHRCGRARPQASSSLRPARLPTWAASLPPILRCPIIGVPMKTL